MKETIVQSGASQRITLYLTDVWEYRDLIAAFAARDIKARYTQTVLGVAWVLLTPLITVGVFSFVFGLMVKIPSDGLPYLLFYLVAIIPWYAFNNVVNTTVTSIEANSSLISKIYFPRILLGASHAASALVDFIVGYVLIIGFAVYFRLFTLELLLVTPLLVVIQTAFALGIGYFFAPLNARFRDVKFLVPLGMQLFYFATPVMYPSSVAPEWVRFWYALNPMSVVIEGYRTALRGEFLNGTLLLSALVIAVAFLAVGAVFFVTREQDLVDVL